MPVQNSDPHDAPRSAHPGRGLVVVVDGLHLLRAVRDGEGGLVVQAVHHPVCRRVLEVVVLVAVLEEVDPAAAVTTLIDLGPLMD